MRKMSAEEPCICGSKQRWASCCGRDLESKTGHALFTSITGKPAVRFFLSNMHMTEAFTDEEDNIIVFTRRSQAMACNESMKSAFIVVGMSEEKWAKFQKDHPQHMVISDAVA